MSPIRVYIAAALAFAAATSVARVASAFHYFEHKWLGDVACARIAASIGTGFSCVIGEPDTKSQAEPDGLSRGPKTLSFGDLVAMAGDHFDDPEELFAAMLHWRSECMGSGECIEEKLSKIIAAREHQAAGVRGWGALGPLRSPEIAACTANRPGPECVTGLTKLIDLGRYVGSIARASCYQPGPYDESLFIATPDYLGLAARDEGHFGARAEHNFRTYAEEASTLFATTDSWKVGILDRAWVTAAFALHFFTDRFAAGHIRTNPAISVSEVKRRHDYDNADGIEVTSEIGGIDVTWRAYGDMCLFSFAANQHRGATAIATTRALSSMTQLTADFAEPELPPGSFDLPYVSDSQRDIEHRLATHGFPALSAFFDTNFGELRNYEGDANPPVPAPATIVESTLRPNVGVAAWVLQPQAGHTAVDGAATIGVDYIINPNAQAARSYLGWRGFDIGVRHDSDNATVGLLGVELGYMRLSRLWSTTMSLNGAFGTHPQVGTMWGFDGRLGVSFTPPGPYTISASLDDVAFFNTNDVTAKGTWVPSLLFAFATRLSDGP